MGGGLNQPIRLVCRRLEGQVAAKMGEQVAAQVEALLEKNVLVYFYKLGKFENEEDIEYSLQA